jgi:formylmethanofuran dehydrogenase subunit D
MEKYKKVLEKKEMYVQFSEEELNELGWRENQKISIELKDGNIILKPFASVELNMDFWPREILEHLIKESCEKDLSVNDIISDTLKEMLNHEKEGYEY